MFLLTIQVLLKYQKELPMFNELVIKNTPAKELLDFNFVLST